MDNVATEADTQSEALQYYTTARSYYFQKASINLRQWASNTTTLNKKVHKDGVEATLTVKVLGLIWNTNSDKLALSLVEKLKEEINHIEKFTKRTTLSRLSSKLFNFLGFMESITGNAKILMQELWTKITRKLQGKLD